ncbi:MAG: 3-carboxy-cis,cis-muconate cycloisomerase [Flavisolibacter sp.]|nr:3-carboxy-cis,cis-muconate cycloisomerase [Flavisolibacter sp.]
MLYERIFYNENVSRLYTDEATISYLLRFENALAEAQAKHGLILDEAASVIAECCRVENINIEQLIHDAAFGGNAAIPLIKQLIAVVKQKNAEAAKWVHFGATSQDMIDTAMMLQTKDAFHIILEDLRQLNRQLVTLIKEHRKTVMIGRSFMQQARPITFGYKVAGWLESLLRSLKEGEELLQKGFVLQMGGAVGTLSGMNEKGLQVSETMSDFLHLTCPAKPWHTQRDYVVRIATSLGILTGNIGKIAKDISLLMQTEIAEVLEPVEEGKGGSSTMPHKRNPVGSIAILANAARVPALVSTMLSCMVQDHERATGLWHAEWEILSSIVQLTAGCVRKAIEVTNGLEVRKEQMLRNLELTNGQIYAENVSLALAEKIGKEHAHQRIEKYCQEARENNLHLKEVLLSKQDITALLSAVQINHLFEPAASIGLSNEMIKQVLHEDIVASGGSHDF